MYNLGEARFAAVQNASWQKHRRSGKVACRTDYWILLAVSQRD